MRRLVPLLAAGTLLLTAAPAYAFGSTPDSTFGINGRVSFSGSDPVIVQQGGWTYVAYSFWGGIREEPVVERLDASGTPDPAFGSGGMALLGHHGHVMSFAVTPSGDAYLATFNSSAPRTGWSTAVLHMTADGQLDKTYGAHGVAVVSMRTKGSLEFPNSISVTGAGTVLVAGIASHRRSNRTYWTGYVQRVLPDGSLDPSFSGDGRRNYPARNNLVVNAWSTGTKTVVVGSRGKDGWVMRLRHNGAVDRTYGVDGVRTITSRLGRIDVLMGGPTTSGTVLTAVVNDRANQQTSLLTVHVTDGGQFDTSYSGDGRASLTVCTHCYLNDWTIADDGTVAAVGAQPVQQGAKLRPWTTVIQPDGTPDPGFGSSGWTFLSPARADTFFTAVAMDGDALVVGSDVFRMGQEHAVVTKYVAGP